MSDVILTLRQEGIVRATGYQVTQWAEASPASYAPMFVVDRHGGREVYARLATLRDLVELPQAELRYFEARGTDGDTLLATAEVGMTLRVTPAPAHWAQTVAPYTDADFDVVGVVSRVAGVDPVVLLGSQLQLPGYTFTPDDIGRWVLISGCATGGHDGYCQILDYTGSTARVNKIFTANETGSTWAFRVVSVATDKYFPTAETDLGWELRTAGDGLATSGGAGVTLRDATDDVVRSVRFTKLAATLGDATALMEATRAALAALQRAGSLDGTSFTTVITTVVGP